MDWRIAITLIGSTLLLVTDHYRSLFPEKWVDHLLLYFFIPIMLIKFIYRQPLKQFGFRLGEWKIGLVFCLIGWLFSVILVFIALQFSDFQAYYFRSQGEPWWIIFRSAMDLIGWEFVFRGWLLYSLLPVCGPYAILLQAIPFSIAHFGKPEIETISCIFGGSLFGYISWRTKSFYYPFLIHWFLTTITILLARQV